MGVPKIGYASGTCSKCGKLLIRKRPADIAICDCYRYCPLCEKEMNPFNPATYPLYPYALSFDGANDYVEAPAITPDYWSLEAWIKIPSGIIETHYSQIISEYGGYGFKLGFEDVDNGVEATVYNGIIWLHAGPVVLSTDVWYHVVGTNDGTEIKLYVDGVLKESGGSATTVYDNTKGVVATGIGIGQDLTKLFKGFIDEVRIYNRALSAAEILKRYRGEPAGEDALVLWMHFNEKTAKDYSVYGNDGTVYGATFVQDGRPIKGHVIPSVYRVEESFAVKGQAVESPEWALSTLYVCYNHSPPYYSDLKPVEVKLS